jgi:hypothetical protein
VCGPAPLSFPECRQGGPLTPSDRAAIIRLPPVVRVRNVASASSFGLHWECHPHGTLPSSLSISPACPALHALFAAIQADMDMRRLPDELQRSCVLLPPSSAILDGTAPSANQPSMPSTRRVGLANEISLSADDVGSMAISKPYHCTSFLLLNYSLHCCSESYN